MSNMQALMERFRGLFGTFFPEQPISRFTGKRDRSNIDEDYSDDELPSLKKLRSLGNTKFPRHMSDKDEDELYKPKTSKVRYVPIQVEGEYYPNTSTPNEGLQSIDRRRTLPSRMLGETEVRPVQRQRSATRAPRDDDPELSWMEPKTRSYQSPSASGNPEMYVLLDDDEDEDEQDENDADVVYVRRVEPRRKFFASPDTRQIVLNRKHIERRESSPKSNFKSPRGVSKGYRQKPISHVAKWLNPVRSTTLGQIPLRNRMSQLNSNKRSAILEAFNLEEKRNYRDLIRQIAERTKPVSPVTKSSEVIDLVNDYSSFRATQQAQRQSLSQLNETAKKVSIAEETPSDKEYDPVTIASFNSSDSEVEIVQNSSNTSSSSTRIQPVNSLRKSFKECPMLDPHWAENLSSRYRKKIQEKTARSCDMAREVGLIGEINREHAIAQLQRNLKHDLKLTDDVELIEEEAAEIPSLAADQEKLVDRALGAGPGGQVFIDKFNLQIHRRDLQTLAGLNWLNDEVINFYMNLITQRSEERDDLPGVYTANTFFYPKLMQSGQPGLRRWTRKVDIFSKQLMCIPVHLGVHWCMCLVDLKKKQVLYLDSMGGPNQKCLDAVLKYLIDEHLDKKGAPMDVKGWQKIQLKDIPQQMNGSDCGMFSITFAEYAARRAPFTFTQADMPRLRRKVCCEILQGKLMQ